MSSMADTTPSSSSGKKGGKLDPLDRIRCKKLYQYLLALTDLKTDSSGKYDEGHIVAQWGMSDNRVFVRRVVRSIQENDQDSIPGITLNKLVRILESIHKYRQKQRKQPSGRIFPQILTRAEKLKALNLYAKLRPEERKDIGLEEHEKEALLQQLLANITDPHKGLTTQNISQICKDILGYSELEIGTNSSEDYDLDIIVGKSIDRIAAEYFSGLNEQWLETFKKTIFDNVKNAIRDIEYQTGSHQLKKYLAEDTDKGTGNINKKEQEINIVFSPEEFIIKLTRSIVDNQSLMEDFPIGIKYIEFKEIQSLPGVKNDTFQDSNRVFAYTIRVYFYFQNSNGDRIEFYEDAMGVGSPLSHAIAAINRALLWDIPSLKDYIPIAKEVMIYHEIVGSSTNGSVWSHYVVGLCKRSEIKYALEHDKDSCTIENISSSDCCGFDILEVSAKAAFYARLRAIKQTGISPEDYISELRTKLEKVKDLRAGEKLLNDYPFSREAMRSILREKLLCGCYEEDENGYPIPESVKKEPWRLIEYEAHLSITEAYFKEGLYAIGKKYLDCIEPHTEDYDSNPINKIILARYHLCYFRYHYLTDLANPNHPNNNRNIAVNNANENLDFAYKHLKEYVHKCKLIDELPHINFYDFFGVMSKLYAHRAKLNLFMSKESIDKPIELFEEARMCAVRSGNSSLYSMWSAYQSWCYLIAAYDDKNINTKEEYIDRAKRLLGHALQSYQKTGRSYYESIKQKSGKMSGSSSNTQNNEPYGKIQIQGIPLIREFESQNKERAFESENKAVGYNHDEGSLTLDMSYLSVDCGNSDGEETLLFGTQSSMLIFAMAMLELCKYNDDNSSTISEDRIQTAKKMFGYSWSFAADGLGNKNADGSYDRLFKIDKDIPQSLNKDLESQYLRGLYPHRLTQFADFGKIYFIVCELILLSQPSSERDRDERWKYIENLLTNLQGSESEAEKIEGDQKRYNGHLQEHFEAIHKYVNSFKTLIGSRQSIPLTTIRNIVVRDIAKILRTGQEQVPRLPTTERAGI